MNTSASGFIRGNMLQIAQCYLADFNPSSMSQRIFQHVG
jgi:hypothetical protein